MISVIGDIIIDKYVYGTSTRLSPEAPVPIVTHQRTIETQGGAGLVYSNLKSLGLDVDLFDYDCPKSIKTRVLCDGHYVTRIDDDVIANSDDIFDKITAQDWSEYEYVILSDYNKGTLEYAKDIIEHLNSFGCKVIVDPKRDCSHYEGAWLVKPNFSEYTKFNFNTWKGNIITTNADKEVVAKINSEEYIIPVDKVEVSDVTGAGDCFMAGFVYGLTKNYDYKKCVETAIRGSTESVKHVGTYKLQEKDLLNKVVFTNGCFDVLHKGHLTLLKEARSLGDKLVVGLNSDESVKRIKGSDRPFNDLDTRKEQLLLIPYVDDVIIFEEDTPYNLIKKLSPDLIVKGGDYTVEQIIGHDLAPVHIVPTVEGYSTSKILEAT